MLGLQTRLAPGVTTPLATEAVFALVLTALLVGLRLIHEARNSFESAISHDRRRYLCLAAINRACVRIRYRLELRANGPRHDSLG